MGLFRALTPAMLVPLLAGLPTRFVVRTMLRFVYGDLRGPDTRDVDELRAPSQFPEYTRALRNLLHEFDWEAEFPRLAMPHMVIAGTRDHLSPARDAHRYARGESLVIVEGAGHRVPWDQPAEFERHLVQVMASQGSMEIPSCFQGS